MDKNLRRVLYIALVAGGLVVVGASSAYAAGEGLLDPVTQGLTNEAEGAATGGSALDAVVADAPQAGKGVDATAGGAPAEDAPAEDAPNVAADAADDAVVPGTLGTLAPAGFAGVVDGTVGEDGLVGGLLGCVLAADTDAPGPDQPGPGEPGTDEPGLGEPGTDEPGTDGPGTDPDFVEPGTDPGFVDSGTDPGFVDPGTDGPGKDGPEKGDTGAGAGADNPAADGPVFRPGGEAPGVAMTSRTGAGTVGGPGYRTAGREAAAMTGSDDPVGAGASPDGPRVDRDLPFGGVDIGWGHKADVVPAAYDGTILPGGLSDGLGSTLTGFDGQAAPVVVPGETLAQTGPLITGQLALVSLLLGLGLAVLRTCRRRIVVPPRIDG